MLFSVVWSRFRFAFWGLTKGQLKKKLHLTALRQPFYSNADFIAFILGKRVESFPSPLTTRTLCSWMIDSFS